MEAQSFRAKGRFVTAIEDKEIIPPSVVIDRHTYCTKLGSLSLRFFSCNISHSVITNVIWTSSHHLVITEAWTINRDVVLSVLGVVSNKLFFYQFGSIMFSLSIHSTAVGTLLACLQRQSQVSYWLLSVLSDKYRPWGNRFLSPRVSCYYVYPVVLFPLYAYIQGFVEYLNS